MQSIMPSKYKTQLFLYNATMTVSDAKPSTTTWAWEVLCKWWRDRSVKFRGIFPKLPLECRETLSADSPSHLVHIQMAKHSERQVESLKPSFVSKPFKPSI